MGVKFEGGGVVGDVSKFERGVGFEVFEPFSEPISSDFIGYPKFFRSLHVFLLSFFKILLTRRATGGNRQGGQGAARGGARGPGGPGGAKGSQGGQGGQAQTQGGQAGTQGGHGPLAPPAGYGPVNIYRLFRNKLTADIQFLSGCELCGALRIFLIPSQCNLTAFHHISCLSYMIFVSVLEYEVLRNHNTKLRISKSKIRNIIRSHTYRSEGFLDVQDFYAFVCLTLCTIILVGKHILNI